MVREGGEGGGVQFFAFGLVRPGRVQTVPAHILMLLSQRVEGWIVFLSGSKCFDTHSSLNFSLLSGNLAFDPGCVLHYTLNGDAPHSFLTNPTLLMRSALILLLYFPPLDTTSSSLAPLTLQFQSVGYLPLLRLLLPSNGQLCAVWPPRDQGRAIGEHGGLVRCVAERHTAVRKDDAAGRQHAGPGGEETCGGQWERGRRIVGDRAQAMTRGDGDRLVVDGYRDGSKETINRRINI